MESDPDRGQGIASSSHRHGDNGSVTSRSPMVAHVVDLGRINLDGLTAPSVKAATKADLKQNSCKCPQPPADKEGRNLVVCIDGTANQFSLNVGCMASLAPGCNC